jgi:hypothetical protein
MNCFQTLKLEAVLLCRPSLMVLLIRYTEQALFKTRMNESQPLRVRRNPYMAESRFRNILAALR